MVGNFEDYQCQRRSSALFNSDFRPWGKKESLTLLNFFVRKTGGRGSQRKRESEREACECIRESEREQERLREGERENAAT